MNKQKLVNAALRSVESVLKRTDEKLMQGHVVVIISIDQKGSTESINIEGNLCQADIDELAITFGTILNKCQDAVNVESKKLSKLN